jgi:chromate reductase
MSDKTQIRLLGLSGSLRTGSYSTAILETLAEAVADRACLTIFGLETIPAYNQDFEGELRPPPVKALRGAIEESDGLVMVTPEFNHGIPGVLKNALDWASRPAFKSVLRDKPSVCMTNSPGTTGGVRAHAQMRETLASCLARIVVAPEVVITGVSAKIVNGRLVDEASLAFATAAIDAMIEEIRWWRRLAPREE